MLRNKTEIKHCRLCSREIKRYFISAFIHVVRATLDDFMHMLQTTDQIERTVGSCRQFVVVFSFTR